jgi:hypothetical protein
VTNVVRVAVTSRRQLAVTVTVAVVCRGSLKVVAFERLWQTVAVARKTPSEQWGYIKVMGALYGRCWEILNTMSS